MEPTYYWDALSREARLWLEEHTPAGRTFLFATNPSTWRYLRRTGDLPQRLYPIDPDPRSPDPPLWYVVQNRPGAFLDVDRALATQGRAEYVVTKLGVPLVWIFPAAEYQRLEPQSRRPSLSP
jgi:hypothetical protein